MVFRCRALGRGGFNALAAALVGFIAFSACHGFPPAVALSIDEYSRECLAIDVDRSIDADGVVRCLERLAAQRGAPAYVRFDHGPEFIAHAVADWRRFNSTDTVFIDPARPGRTPGSSPSTAGYETSSSTASSSTPSSRPEFS
jgi:transposase InsO family protein